MIFDYEVSPFPIIKIWERMEDGSLNYREEDFLPFFGDVRQNLASGDIINKELSPFPGILGETVYKYDVLHPKKVPALRPKDGKGSFQSNIVFTQVYLTEKIKEYNPRYDIGIIDIEADDVGSHIGDSPMISLAVKLFRTYRYNEDPNLDCYGYVWRHDLPIGQRYVEDDKVKILIKTYPSKYQMLEGFVVDIENGLFDPDVLTSWFTGYDIRTLVNELRSVGIDPTRIARYPFIDDRGFNTFKIGGRVVKDSINIFGTFQFEKVTDDMSLKEVSMRMKLKYSKIMRGDTKVGELWRRSIDELMLYNVYDVLAVWELLHLRNLSNTWESIIKLTKCVPERTDHGSHILQAFYLKQAHQRMWLPYKTAFANQGTLKGAKVLDPPSGRKRWIHSLDASAQYPSIRKEFRLSYENTVILSRKLLREYWTEFKLWDDFVNEEIFDIPKKRFEDLLFYAQLHDERVKKMKKPVLLHNGVVVDTGVEFALIGDSVGILIDENKRVRDIAVEHLKQAEEAKNRGDEEQYNYHYQQNILKMGESNALKALRNTDYGVVNMPSFFLYSPAVSHTTLFVPRMVVRYLNRYIDDIFIGVQIESKWGILTVSHAEVLYGDTDSIYFEMDFKEIELYQESLGDIADFLKHAFDKVINAKIDAAMADFVEAISTGHDYKGNIVWKWETTSKTILFKKADKKSGVKKKNARHVVIKDGYVIDELEQTGFIKGDMPKRARDFRKKCLELVIKDEMDFGEFLDWVGKEKQNVRLELEEALITNKDILRDYFPSLGLQKKEEEYKAIPQHLRAANYSRDNFGLQFWQGSRVHMVPILRVNGIPETNIIGFTKDQVYDIPWDKQVESNNTFSEWFGTDKEMEPIFEINFEELWWKHYQKFVEEDIENSMGIETEKVQTVQKSLDTYW